MVHVFFFSRTAHSLLYGHETPALVFLLEEYQRARLVGG